MKGQIFDIKEMAVHDGPGLRTTVFFKGCPLRCRWCHNPEGLSALPQLMYKETMCIHCGRCRIACEHADCEPFGRCVHVCPHNCLEIVGRTVEADELATVLRSGVDTLGENFGGVTFSGGEPLAQPEFLQALAKQLDGIHLCMETSGYAETAVFERTVDAMDFVIMDVKLADNEKHRQYTGVGNEKILDNLRRLQRSGKAHLLRTPLIPNITDTAKNLKAIRQLVGDSDWEQLPYNRMAGAKYNMLGIHYTL